LVGAAGTKGLLVADVAQRRAHAYGGVAGRRSGGPYMHACMYAYVGATAYARMLIIKWIRLAMSCNVLDCAGAAAHGL